MSRDILFTFHYMLNAPTKFTTLIISKIDKSRDFESQSQEVRKVAKRISEEFTVCFHEVLSEMEYNLSAFEPFEERCDLLLQKIATESAVLSQNGI
ncbi:MAG: hypothetical protein ACTSQQ_14700 [Candidatus Helarchaeota archaeon]